MIIIRDLCFEDLDFFISIRNECANDFLHDSRIFTIEDAKKWFANSNPKYYIINYNSTDIGYFRTSNYSEVNQNIYIGCDLHKEWRGKGLSYLAYLEFIPSLFQNLNLHKISLEVLSTNVVAYNLYKKIGFIEEGRKRDEIFKQNKWVDSIIMSLKKEEYFNKYGK